MANLSDPRVPKELLAHRLLGAEDDARQLPDFIDFLSERLATSRASAMDVLTSLVEAYEPAGAYEIRVLHAVEPVSV